MLITKKHNCIFFFTFFWTLMSLYYLFMFLIKFYPLVSCYDIIRGEQEKIPPIKVQQVQTATETVQKIQEYNYTGDHAHVGVEPQRERNCEKWEMPVRRELMARQVRVMMYFSPCRPCGSVDNHYICLHPVPKYVSRSLMVELHKKVWTRGSA
jgi:hypothetical protein